MKPVTIFRFAPTEGPGYFATFLSEYSIPWQLVRIDAGDQIPSNTHSSAGFVFMGGPMSVNDDLEWIPKVVSLIRHAIGKDIPVLGHCLGGQLIAKAMGATIHTNPVKEIGWGPVQVADNQEAHTWFGDHTEFPCFHWHEETFSIPRGFTRILSSTYCANQAFTRGRHLGLQCHIEMTEEMIRTWCDTAEDYLSKNASASIQSAELIKARIGDNLPTLNIVAKQLYKRWIQGLSL
jgi:GMP synthase-like glutamine amidotransferase